MQYRIKKSTDNKYYWTFIATNGKIIVTSETLDSHSACLIGIQISKRSITIYNFEVRHSKDLKYYFVQKANNHEILCVSEVYETQNSCLLAIDLIRKNGPSAPIVDF